MSSQQPLPGQAKLSLEARRELTKNMIKTMPPIKTPPPGFDHTKASNKELLENGFPPRPDKEKNPELRKLWEKTIARKLTFVEPELKINESFVHRPLLQLDFVERELPSTKGVTANSSNLIWSGAVLPSPPTNQKFNIISSSWIVPNPYPPPSAKKSNGTWSDGTWSCCTWIGIDGYGTEGVLQAGTVSECTVRNGVLSQSAYAWYEWFPALMIEINLPVKPGDLVHAVVCGSGTGPGDIGITNLSTNTAFPLTQINEPTDPNNKNTLVPIQGQTAEWITEDFSSISGSNPVVYTPVPFANYGATFLYNCWASSTGSGSTTESNLTNATLLNIVQNNTTLSTAFSENASCLQTTAYNEPSSNNPTG